MFWITRNIRLSTIHLLLLGYTLIVLYPLFIMFMSSFKSTNDILSKPFALPHSLNLTNFTQAWTEANFSVYMINSLIVTVASVGLIVFFGSMASYVLARFKFRGNFFVYILFLIGLMLPTRLAIIPLFILVRDLGLLNTHVGLILVYVAGGMPFTIFVLTNFFRNIPVELDEAAYSEGAGPFRRYFSIMLPLVRPALATVAIFNFTGIWNDFFFPLIFLKSEKLMTLPVGMTSFFGEYTTDWNLLFASLVISVMPVLIMFLFMSKQFIEGLSAGAIK